MDLLMRIGYVVNYGLGRDIAGRTVAKLPDDRFVVAYPGSGGQWLRRLIGNLMNPGQPVSDANILERVPGLYHQSRRGFKRMARPRILFSHECYDADCHGRLVYLVRDPRDVAVSIYQQRRTVDRSLSSLEQFVATEFMRTDQYQGGWVEDFSGAIRQHRGSWYLCRLKEGFLGTPASWGENVMSWLGARGEDPEGMLMVRYEDLFAHPHEVLARIVEFLDLRSLSAKIPGAVQMSREGAKPRWPQRPGIWQTDLPPSAVGAIEGAWSALMVYLGYSPTSSAHGS
jgi:sulfotransferase family protein